MAVDGGDDRADAIRAFHDSLMHRAGALSPPHYQICGWSSAQSQEDRFAALLRAARYQGGSVVDFGCGTGDLYQFLRRRGLPFSYLGLDVSAEMVKIASGTHGDAEFRRIPIDDLTFGEVDYVFASGVFQFVDRRRPDYYKDLVTGLFSRCRTALAANFLSECRGHAQMRPEELYLHPRELAQLASSLSGRWTLDHSYHPGRGDMTVGIMVELDGAQWRRPHLNL